VIRAAVIAAAIAASTAAQAAPRFYRTDDTARAGLPVSNAVLVGGVLYVSNQLGNGGPNNALVSDGLEAQLDQTFRNIDVVLAANGYARDDIFRCQVALANISDGVELNRLWTRYFKADRLPVRNVLGANGLPLGARVTVECQASRS
jgi:lysine/arginine/ornithine transport system substrate-binding protein